MQHKSEEGKPFALVLVDALLLKTETLLKIHTRSDTIVASVLAIASLTVSYTHLTLPTKRIV